MGDIASALFLDSLANPTVSDTLKSDPIFDKALCKKEIYQQQLQCDQQMVNRLKERKHSKYRQSGYQPIRYERTRIASDISLVLFDGDDFNKKLSEITNKYNHYDKRIIYIIMQK